MSHDCSKSCSFIFIAVLVHPFYSIFHIERIFLFLFFTLSFYIWPVSLLSLSLFSLHSLFVLSSRSLFSFSLLSSLPLFSSSLLVLSSLPLFSSRSLFSSLPLLSSLLLLSPLLFSFPFLSPPLLVPLSLPSSSRSPFSPLLFSFPFLSPPLLVPLSLSSSSRSPLFSSRPSTFSFLFSSLYILSILPLPFFCLFLTQTRKLIIFDNLDVILFLYRAMKKKIYIYIQKRGKQSKHSILFIYLSNPLFFISWI